MKIKFFYTAKWLPIVSLTAGIYFSYSFIDAAIAKKPQAATNTPAPTVAPKEAILPPLVAAPANLPPLVQGKAGQFRIVALPSGFTACGINNKGEVGGTWLINAEKSRAALWRKGKVVVFPTYDKEPARGAAISDAAHVAGSFGSTRTGAYSASSGDVVVWQAAARSTARLIGHLPRMSLAEATAINGRGHVVGSVEPSSIQEREPELRVETASKLRFAFFSSGDEMLLLGSGTAYGINDREQVTGSRNEQHIMLWQRNEALVLGPGEGRAINNRSQIVGLSTAKSARPHAMRWERGVIKDLGVLPGTPESEALAINDRGQIVGHSFDPHDDKRERAFLWQSGAMVDLNAHIPKRAGWVLRQSLGINNKGQIVGLGTFKGEDRSFLLTPR